jgi:acyl-CoA synthetase (AMP-forming)/AMP-acid ligase II
MNGLMMQQPLLISTLLTHAERHHGEQEIVSRRVEGDVHRHTYRDLAARARRVANALTASGIRFGDRVATLAWNGYRHMELYYAVSGSGAVLHTLNPRLHPDQLLYIAEHAEDQVLFFDLSFLPVVAGAPGEGRYNPGQHDDERRPAGEGERLAHGEQREAQVDGMAHESIGSGRDEARALTCLGHEAPRRTEL